MSKPRRLIPLALFLLASAAAWAVQRDTFVRRWLVPRPVARPLLDRRLAEIRFSTGSLDDAMTHLSRTAGVEIRYEAWERPKPVEFRPPALPPFDRTFRDATVDHVLRAIVRHWQPRLYVGGMTLERDGAIRVRPHWPDRGPLVLRMYDVADLVPPSDPSRPSAPIYSPPAGPISRAGALGEIQQELEAAANVGNRYYRSGLGDVQFPARVIRQDCRYFVLTDSESHREVAALLAAAREDARERRRLLGVERPW